MWKVASRVFIVVANIVLAISNSSSVTAARAENAVPAPNITTTPSEVTSAPKNDLSQNEAQKLTGPFFVVTPQPIIPPAKEGTGWAQFLAAALWPATIICLAFLISYNSRLGRLLGLSPKIIKKIRAGGVEMEISADTVDAVRSQLRDSFDELIANAGHEYKRMAELMNLYQHLQRVVQIALPQALMENGITGKLNGAAIRATIHVKDIVFSDYFYQIVDYYPIKSSAAGRRFSQRFGIVGRCIRLEESLGEGQAMTDEATPERSLITDWGMTKQEAYPVTRARPSYLAIILLGIEDGEFPIGVLFIDAEQEDRFGDNSKASKVARELESSSEVVALRKSLAQAMAPLRLAAPNIDIGQGR